MILRIAHGAECISILNKKKQFDADFSSKRLVVDLFRIWDGSYNIELPELGDTFLSLRKTRLGYRYWKLENKEYRVYVGSQVLGMNIVEAFSLMNLPAKDTIIKTCQDQLKYAEKIEDYQWCIHAKKYLDKANQGLIDFRF